MLTQILSFFRTKALSLMALAACTWLVPSTARAEDFTILQWNIWQEGTMVKGGYDAIVEEIVRLKPDFVTLSEVRNYHNTNFTRRLTQSLLQRGLTYYSFKSKDTGLLSRYPITDSLTVFLNTTTTVLSTVCSVMPRAKKWRSILPISIISMMPTTM